MIALLGASGYVGQAFVRTMQGRGTPFRSLSRREVDYYDPRAVAAVLKAMRTEFLINCAGYTGKPNVDACELHRADCLQGNAILPARIREACELSGIPWGHVSSGCIFTGTRPDGSGFQETDPPNFSFRTNHCSFYSGTKALGEELLSDCESCFVWRLRIPFNNEDSPRNYLTKVMRYERLLDATNSLSQLDEFVAACLDCWQRRVPFGIYNVVNGGSVTTREVVELIKSILAPSRDFEFFEDESQFMRLAAKTPRSNCVLNNSKLLQAGIWMSPVREAIAISLRSWHTKEAA